MAAAAYPCGKGTTACAGSINISVFRSTNAGASFSQQNVESVSSGVDFATSALASIAGDAAGNAVVIYTGASSVGATSQVYVRHSTNSGFDMERSDRARGGSVRERSVPGNRRRRGRQLPRCVHGYADGRVEHLVPVVNRRRCHMGSCHSDLRCVVGCAVPPAGFANPYGDYLGIDVMGAGEAVAAWGAAPSWSGPGDIWFNGQT